MSDGITNFGGKFYISDTAFNADVELADCQGATFIQLPNIGNIGETGVTQEPASYSTWDRPVLQKSKGEADAGNPDVECLDVASAGMTQMKAASAATNSNSYIFKILWNDGTVEYNRGLVMGPRLPKGANSDFKRAVFTLACNQEPLFDTESV